MNELFLQLNDGHFVSLLQIVEVYQQFDGLVITLTNGETTPVTDPDTQARVLQFMANHAAKLPVPPGQPSDEGGQCLENDRPYL